MGKAESTTLTERQRYWLEQIQACEASRKTIADYAAEHGIAAQAMYAGKKILVKKGVLPGTRRARFQRTQVVDAVAVGSEWRVELANGVSVAFSGTVDARILTVVLSTAAAVE